MESYCGNARPYIYALFGESDKAEAEKIMEALAENGHSLWYAGSFTKKEEKRLKKAAALLVVISPAFAGSQDLKTAVGQASLANMPIISVYLEETKLSPGLSMLLGTTQGVFRPNFDSDEEMLEKLCAAPVLKNLSVTEGQKAAAKRTTALIALASIAAVAAIALTALNVFREVVPIDPNSDLARLGVSGNALDIEEFYLYGETVLEDYSVCQLTALAHDPAHKLYLEGQDELLPTGQLSTVQDFSQLVNMEELCLAGNPITDVSPLASLTNLRLLDLSCGESMQETDLTPLASLPNLETLNLAFTYIGDLSPLQACPALKTLYLSCNGAWLLDSTSLPGVEVIFVDAKAEDFASLQAACEDETVRNIYITDSITIPEGQTVTVRENVFLSSDSNISLVNNGELVIEGYFLFYECSGRNTGTIRISDAAQFALYDGEFENRGDFYIDYVGTVDLMNNHQFRQFGTMENSGGLGINSGSQFYQNGGAFHNLWELTVAEQSQFHFDGGAMGNDGSIQVNPDSDFVGNHRDVSGVGDFIVEIDPNSQLLQYGLSENAMDTTKLYLYGDTVRDTYAISVVAETWNPENDNAVNLVLSDSGERFLKGNLTDIADFSRLINLDELCLAGHAISDVSPLANLPYLRVLDLSGGGSMAQTDLTPLTSLPNLEVLNLAYTSIEDLTPLVNCPSLKTLYLASVSQWVADRVILPGVDIIYVDKPAGDLETLKALMADESQYSIYLTDSITIPKGETLTIRKGTFVNGSQPKKFTVDGELIIEGTLQLFGHTAKNNGTIRIQSGGWLQLPLTDFENRGQICIAENAAMTTLMNGVIRQTTGTIVNDCYFGVLSGGTFQFDGGTLENNGEINVEPDGNFAGDRNAVTGTGQFVSRIVTILPGDNEA